MKFDVAKLWQELVLLGTQFGMKLIGALILWFVGRRVIAFVGRLAATALQKQPIEKTVAGYLSSSISIALNALLVIVILGFFGVPTTTFAALLAAAGIAIGTAWSGLLANFAAGFFLIALRPFKVGDMIAAAGVTGIVQEIGLFVTTINTADNVRTYVGNNKLFSDNIQNFSANPHRRVDLVAQISHATDAAAAAALLRTRLAKIPNVVATPAPEVEILSFTELGPVLTVRPYCHNEHYWQVYFEANRVIREAFGEAGFPPPMKSLNVKSA
jgi:small conductance mechanosensitive channel